MDEKIKDISYLDEIETAEKERLKNKKSIKNSKTIFITLSIVSVAIIFIFKLVPYFYLLSFFLLLIPFVVQFYLKGNLLNLVKSRVILPALKKLRPNIIYNENDCISASQFNESNLFKYPDRYKGEDLISGSNGKTEFSFSEIHAEEKKTRTNSKGQTTTTYSTIFKGIFMIAEFNKVIKNETYVYTSGGKWLSRFKRVKLEDPVFEDRFNVYSDDQIEARYILTPAMMQRITELEIRFDSKLFMSFIGNHVFIALGNHNNYFEPNVSKEISAETVNEVVAEIDSCISIIDDLDLNTRIWTKD